MKQNIVTIEIDVQDARDNLKTTKEQVDKLQVKFAEMKQQCNELATLKKQLDSSAKNIGLKVIPDGDHTEVPDLKDMFENKFCRKNIIIKGITDARDENIKRKVIDLISTLGVPIHPIDIASVKRVGRTQNKNSKRLRPVRVVFNNIL